MTSFTTFADHGRGPPAETASLQGHCCPQCSYSCGQGFISQPGLRGWGPHVAPGQIHSSGPHVDVGPVSGIATTRAASQVNAPHAHGDAALRKCLCSEMVRALSSSYLLVISAAGSNSEGSDCQAERGQEKKKRNKYISWANVLRARWLLHE